jgi:cobalt/nickel transport system permease protein
MLVAIDIPSLTQAAMPQPMHIPDGYLSPLTSLVMYALAIPFWYLASRRLTKSLTQRMVPVIALLSAFTFVIMMFNVPLPGGTTGHAVGGTIATIILGPWGAGMAVSIALLIQALFFGDGGILAFGANAFNMGVVMPFTAWLMYRLISGNSSITSSRRVVAAFVAGWVSLNLAALATAVEFGIQPYFFRAADGTPLYQPYGLDVAIPAMLIPHMLVASVVEGAVTALIVAYLQRSNLPILALSEPQAVPAGVRGRVSTRVLWLMMAVLAMLTPIGLLAGGTAWGEWAPEELESLGLGFIPQGLQQLSNTWASPIPDYEVPGIGPVPGYILSAVLGIVLVAGVIFLVGRLVARRAAAGS